MSDEFGQGEVFDNTPVSAPEAETSVAPKADAPSIREAVEAAFAKAEGQPRDEIGRFAAKQAEEAAAAAKPAMDPNAQKPEERAAPVSVEAPASWGKERAALFAKADPELQAFIRQREEQISRGFARYEGLAEYAQIAEGNGRTLRDVMREVKQIEDGFVSNPLGTLFAVAQRFGIGREQIAQALNGEMPVQPPQAPAFRPEQVEQIIDQRLAQRQTAQEVSAFFADPANKYAEQVADTMAAMLRADRALSMKDAYDRAIWADPQIRTEIQKDMAAKAQAEQAAKVRAQTQTAQRAAKSLTGSASPASNGPQPLTIKDAIAAAAAMHGSA